MFTPSIKMWCGLRTWNLLNDLILEKMTTKVVYFTVGGKPEQAEFATDFPVDEIKGRISKCLHVQLDCPLLSDYYQALCVLRVILLRTSLLSRFRFIHWDYFNHLFSFDCYWKQNFYGRIYLLVQLTDLYLPVATLSRTRQYVLGFAFLLLALFFRLCFGFFIVFFRLVSLCSGSWPVWYSETLQHERKYSKYLAFPSRKHTRFALSPGSCRSELCKLRVLR